MISPTERRFDFDLFRFRMDALPTEIIVTLLDAIACASGSTRSAFRTLWRLRRLSRRFKAVIDQHLVTFMREHRLDLTMTVRSLECLAVMSAPPAASSAPSLGPSRRPLTPEQSADQQSNPSLSPRLIPISASFPVSPGEDIPAHDIWGIDQVRLCCTGFDAAHGVYEFKPAASDVADTHSARRSTVSSRDDQPGCLTFSRIRSSDMIREVKLDFEGWFLNVPRRRVFSPLIVNGGGNGDDEMAETMQPNVYRDRLYRLDLSDLSGKHYFGETDMICAYVLDSTETDVVRWVPKPGVSTSHDDTDKIAIHATDRRFDVRIDRILVSSAWLLNGGMASARNFLSQPLFPIALDALRSRIPTQMHFNARSEFILHYLQQYFRDDNVDSLPAVEDEDGLFSLVAQYSGFPDRRFLLDQQCERAGIPIESYWHEPSVLRFLMHAPTRERTPSRDRQRPFGADLGGSDLLRLSWQGVTIRATPEMLDPSTAFEQAQTIFLKWQRNASRPQS